MKLIVCLALFVAIVAAQNRTRFAYVGGYQSPPNGIVVFSQGDRGALKQVSVASTTAAISLDANPRDKTLLFSVSESGNSASSWRVKPDGSLTLINTVPSGGSGPAHVKVHHSGKWLFCAMYGSGDFSVLPIGSDGKLGNRVEMVKPGNGSPGGKDNQKVARGHMVAIAPNGQIAGVDLGSDAVYFWNLSPAGKLQLANTFRTATGTGPRNIAFIEKFGLAYVVSENKNDVTVFSYKSSNAKAIQTISTLPADFKGVSYGARIAVHPNRKFIFVTNRGHDSIVTFAVDQNTGKLTTLHTTSSRGKFPRGMRLDPTGRYMYVANQNSNQVATFSVENDGRVNFISSVTTTMPTEIEFF